MLSCDPVHSAAYTGIGNGRLHQSLGLCEWRVGVFGKGINEGFSSREEAVPQTVCTSLNKPESFARHKGDKKFVTWVGGVPLGPSMMLLGSPGALNDVVSSLA